MASTADINTLPVYDNRAVSNWLPLMAVWHGLLGLLGLLSAWAAFTTGQFFGVDLTQIAPAIRAGIAVTALVVAVASFAAMVGILGRHPYGRILSLILNYTGFILTLVTALQVMQVFTGIDILASKLSNAVPVFILLGISALLYENLHIGPTARVKQGLKVIIGILIAIALIQVGLLEGIVNFARFIPSTIPLIIATILFGTAAWIMFRRPMALLFGERLSTREAVVGWLFLSPNIFGFLIFFAGPLLLSLYLSFTQYELFSAPVWKGTENYTQILGISVGAYSASDPNAHPIDVMPKGYEELTRQTIGDRVYVLSASDALFWTALRNTATWVLMLVPLAVIPALLLAVLLNSKLPGMKLFRTLFFLPVVAGVVGVALIWSWLYNPEIGAFNVFISGFVNSINGLAGRTILTDPKIHWLTSQDSAQFSIVVMAAWMSIGYNMVIFLAGLQNIPRPLYEAARVDGATGWSAFWNITLPMLAPTTFFVVTTTLINAFQVFTEPYTMALNNGSGPSNTTLTTVVYLYKTGFANANHMGYASAIAWILVLIIFVLTLIQFRLSERYTDVN